MFIYHDARCAEYSQAGHPERPARVLRTASALRERHPHWAWALPESASRKALSRAHSAAHVSRIEAGSKDFDADTPAYPEIYAHAARAAGASIAIADSARTGQDAFSLMRPPGHHATRERAMGFCYFSHVAVAALDAISKGAARVAIWDFDAHHGNGTEDIIAGNAQIRFASVHQFPAYPGTGARSFDNVKNVPIAPMTARDRHMIALRESLDQLLAFNPELLLVSAGFDAYVDDPITQMTLELEDFATIGGWLRETNVPTGAILEGGYSDDLPDLVDAFLSAWSGNGKSNEKFAGNV